MRKPTPISPTSMSSISIKDLIEVSETLVSSVGGSLNPLSLTPETRSPISAVKVNVSEESPRTL